MWLRIYKIKISLAGDIFWISKGKKIIEHKYWGGVYGGCGSNEDWKVIECSGGIWKYVVHCWEYAYITGKLDCLSSISIFSIFKNSFAFAF